MNDIDERALHRITPYIRHYLDNCDIPTRIHLADTIGCEDGTYNFDWHVGSNGRDTWLDVLAAGTLLMTINAADVGLHVIDRQLVYDHDPDA